MYNNIIKEVCEKYGLDSIFIRALIATESNFNANAVRYEPNYKDLYSFGECAKMIGCDRDTMIIMQKCSWGLCQIMGAVYYEMQGKNFATALLDPATNIKFCGEYLHRLINRQNLSSPYDIYTAYNAGSIRHLKDGTLVNSKNVNRFKKNYDQLKNI